jgi:hypothetical protein
MARATTSVDVPGESGTIIWIGLDGNLSWAATGAEPHTREVTAQIVAKRFGVIVSSSVQQGLRFAAA